MEKRVVRCLYCGKEFILPETEKNYIVTCPYCEFLQVYMTETGNLTVPTHVEEETLPRYDGIPLELDDTNETTLVQPEFNLENLPMPPGVKVILEVIEGNDKGKVFHINKARVRIGRKDVEIPLDDKKVSRKHAAIEIITRENILIRDLASRNGTYLNGVLVFTRKLRNGDIITVGDTKIKVSIETLE